MRIKTIVLNTLVVTNMLVGFSSKAQEAKKGDSAEEPAPDKQAEDKAPPPSEPAQEEDTAPPGKEVRATPPGKEENATLPAKEEATAPSPEEKTAAPSTDAQAVSDAAAKGEVMAGEETDVGETGDAAADQEFDELAGLSLEELLDTQVTTASKGEEKLSDAPGVMTVVTKDEIRRFGGNTLKDILNRVPGLITSTTYFADRTTIASRGDQIRIDSGHVLILVNGRPTREVLQGGVASEVLESFPVSIIERIEIIRGPGSVLYGSNAFSAVINIITETGTNSTFVKGMVGVPLSHGEFAKSTVTVGDLQLSVAGNYLRRADWDTTYRYPSPDTVDVTPMDISIPNERAGAYFGLRYKGLSLSSMYNQWNHAYFYRGTVGDNKWRRGFGDLGYRLNVTEKIPWNMEFHGTFTYAGMVSSDTPEIERKSYDVVGEWTNFLQILDNLGLVVGGLYNYNRGKEEAGTLTVSDGSRSSGGFYTQVDYQPWKILSLIAGMQLNKIQDIDVDVVPRGGIILNPIPRLNIKALYGQAYRAPSINELKLREIDLWGNPKLRPEKVQTVDAGVAYLGEKVNLGANYFFTLQKDIIMVDQTPSRFDAPAEYANLGRVQFQGVELEGKYYILRSLYLTGSFLYFFNKDNEDETNVTPIANLGAKGGLSYMDDNGITASVFYIFQGPLDDKYDARENPDPQAYHLLNLYCSFDSAKFFKLRFPEGLAVFVEGENLINQKIWLPDWGGVLTETIPVNPGMTLFFGLSGTFAYDI